MRVIDSISFAPDGAVVLSFLDTTTDVRNGELLLMSHQLIVRPGEGGRDYGDEIEDVREAAQRLLNDAMDDWNTTSDIGVAMPEDPDDERD